MSGGRGRSHILACLRLLFEETLRALRTYTRRSRQTRLHPATRFHYLAKKLEKAPPLLSYRMMIALPACRGEKSLCEVSIGTDSGVNCWPLCRENVFVLEFRINSEEEEEEDGIIYFIPSSKLQKMIFRIVGILGMQVDYSDFRLKIV